MTSEPDTKTQITHELTPNVLRIVECGKSFAKPNSCEMWIEIEYAGMNCIDVLKNLVKTGEIVKQSLLSIGGLEVLSSPLGYEFTDYDMKCGREVDDCDFESDDECENKDEDNECDNECENEAFIPTESATLDIIVKSDDIASIPVVISKMVEISNVESGKISVYNIKLDMSDELKQKEAEKAIKDAYDKAKANIQIISRATGLTLKNPKESSVEIDYDPDYGHEFDPDHGLRHALDGSGFEYKYPDWDLESLSCAAMSCDDIFTSVFESCKIVTTARVKFIYECFEKDSGEK